MRETITQMQFMVFRAKKSYSIYATNLLLARILTAEQGVEFILISARVYGYGESQSAPWKLFSNF